MIYVLTRDTQGSYQLWRRNLMSGVWHEFHYYNDQFILDSAVPGDQDWILEHTIAKSKDLLELIGLASLDLMCADTIPDRIDITGWNL